MILTCPECSTRYALDARQLGTAGRKVKCVRCGHVWFQERPADAPVAPASAEEVAGASPPSGAAEALEPRPAAAAGAAAGPAIGNRAAPVERGGLPSTEFRTVRRGRAAAGWVALVLLIAGLLTVGAAARHQIVAMWPPALKLYDTLGLPVDTAGLAGDPAVGAGLSFGQLVTEIAGSGEDRRLIVRGEVTNVSDVPRPVPRLRVTLTDSAGESLGGWTFEAERSRLAPGESVGFEAATDRWPDAATGVEVTVAGPEEGAEDGPGGGQGAGAGDS